MEPTPGDARASGKRWTETTRSVLGDDSARRARSAFRDRTKVRVMLLETRHSQGERPGAIGAGYLVERLAIGSPMRVAIEDAPAFVTSRVCGLQRLGRDAVRVETLNSVYRLERWSPGAELGPGAPVGSDVAQGVPSPATAPKQPDDSTAFVPVSQLVPLENAPFGSGARMRISRTKTHDPGSERLGDLGSGKLLDRLEVGQTVRLSVDGGPTFVTSPIRAIHRLGPKVLEIETTNSSYRLQKIDAPGS